ncbi:MAG TPA: hypothetical protein VIC33_09095 [Vicinamibacterales bacterium]|jgi:hypothetical protein
MRSAAAIFSTLLVAIAAAPGAAARGQAPPAPTPAPAVTAAARWQPGAAFLQQAHAACDAEHPTDYGACFVDQMRGAGAPDAATAFAARLNSRPDGLAMPGILHDFTEAGAVDIAFVWFPLRANENQACLLVNGTPDLVDVDDPTLLAASGLKRIATYVALARRHPAISLWPGARTGTRAVQVRVRRGGGQRFILPYVLRNGCHACATLGSARIAFDFDKTGTFIGTRVIDVRGAGRPRRRARR